MTDNRIDIESYSTAQLDLIARHVWAEEISVSGDPHSEEAVAFMDDMEEAFWKMVNVFQGFRYPDDPDAPNSSGVSNPLMQEMAYSLCLIPYYVGKRTAGKLAEANGKLEAHLRANDGTEIWNAQCAKLRRTCVRLQDRIIVWRRVYLRWCKTCWPEVARQLKADGMEWIEVRFSPPDEAKAHSEVRRISVDAYLAELNTKRTAELLHR